MTKWTKEQELAIYKDGTNIIVSAGAGSGKTAVLTERVLEKVKRGISLSNLLILTFTNLAASEMRERIGDKLKKAGLTKELAKVDTADITTFDAYALSLVKKYHFLLGVAKDISIIDSSVIELYKRKKLREIFDRLYEEDKSFQNLIKTYCLKDDKELFDFIININNKLDLKINKKEYLNNYIITKYNEETINKDIDKYIEDIKEKITMINDYLYLIEDTNLKDKLYITLSYLLSSRTYDEIKQNIPAKLDIVRNTDEVSKEYKSKINDLLKEIKSLCSYESIKDIKEGILYTKEYVETIINIIKELDIEVNKYKNKYNYFEYHDIAYLAIKLVKENKEVCEEIKNNLNEILIDEYQDTNDIQETFISYISNNNVYMVGDVKQSIYRFRNANPYIFKNKYDKYSSNNDGIKIDLNKNFRSREEVISNINEIFDKIMDDTLGGASYKESHQMIFGNITYNEEGKTGENNNFEIYNYLNDNKFKKEEVEAFIIAKDIKEKVQNGYLIFDAKTGKQRKIEYKDFAILMDNSRNFELFKKILEYSGVPTIIMKTSNLLEGDIVPIIKNIISIIIKIKKKEIDKEFKKLFMSLGRSFLYNIDDNTLFNYFINNNYEESTIYKDAYEISKKIDGESISSIFNIILEEYNFYENLILLGDYKNNITRIDKLKEIINNLINLDYDIYMFNNYLEDIIENNIKIEFKDSNTGSSSVRIMTIHASKGLEFSICYYACLSSKFNIREVINKYSYDDKYGIILPFIKDFTYNTIYHTLSYNDYVKENISERIRLFYVALTRAKEKMIFVLPQNTKESKQVSDIVDINIRSKYSSFASIIYSLEDILKPVYKNTELDKLNLTKDYNLIKNDNIKDNITLSKELIEVKELNIITTTEEEKHFSKDSRHLITKKEKENLDYGTRMHEILELTDFKNINYNNITEAEKKFIDNFLSKIDLTNIVNIYKEYEFIYEEENTTYHGIIDLMLEYPDNIKIIDYKLNNIEDPLYINQLNGYKKYIEGIFNKEVTIYLYSITKDTLKKL